MINFIGFVFILAGAFAPGNRKYGNQQQSDDQDADKPTIPGGLPAIRKLRHFRGTDEATADPSLRSG